MKALKTGTTPRTGSRLLPTLGRRENGMTTLGLMLVVAIVGLIAFAGIRLTPVYLNYLKVVGVIDGVHDEFDSQNPSRSAIRTSINRRFQIESVSELSDRDVTVTAHNRGFEIVAKYDHTTPFLANIYFTVKFEKSEIIRK